MHATGAGAGHAQVAGGTEALRVAVGQECALSRGGEGEEEDEEPREEHFLDYSNLPLFFLSA